MNNQIRRMYLIIMIMFGALAIASTYIQFFAAPRLNADERNSRTILHAAERDRGPIIVNGSAIAQSMAVEGTKRYRRTYTDGPLYAPVTGWFSASLSSATGLEAAADDIFEGDAPSLFTQRIQSLITGSARRGGGVNLTLDAAVQKAAQDGFAGRRGAAVAIDPRTGAIRALYSSPSFDPNPIADPDSKEASSHAKALEDDPARPLNNRAIASDLYPPGSVFKLVTTAAMLENGASADTEVSNAATATLPGTNVEVPNFSGLPCVPGDKATLHDVFIRSCNTGFIDASTHLPPTTIADKAREFGITDELSVPLPVTPSRLPEESNATEQALASIGQGKVSVTPMAMAMVGSAIANGGTLMKPYLVESVVNADLVVKSTSEPEEMSRPISPEVAEQLRSLMIDVVDDPAGTAHGISRGDRSIAAKTGTAETSRKGQTIGWIVSFAPADNPTLVVVVAVEGDEVTPYAGGGTDAGPIARAMLDAGGAK